MSLYTDKIQDMLAGKKILIMAFKNWMLRGMVENHCFTLILSKLLQQK